MRTSLLILCLMFAYAIRSQTNGITTDSIQVSAGSSIYADNLENLYVVTAVNDIIKYGKDGKKLATANFKVLGNVSWMDVTNPFEIYVFYRDQNRLIILDNLLNIRGDLDLESIGVSQIACVARSYDNQIWIFDLADQKLKKYSKDLKLMTESAPWNTLGIRGKISPLLIRDINTSVLILNDSSILEFDIFANYSKIKLKDTLTNFFYVDGKILFLKDSSLYLYNPFAFNMKRLPIEMPSKCRQIAIGKERLFFLTDEFVILRPYKE